jgi:hypothetical protein
MIYKLSQSFSRNSLLPLQTLGIEAVWIPVIFCSLLKFQKTEGQHAIGAALTQLGPL